MKYMFRKIKEIFLNSFNKINKNSGNSQRYTGFTLAEVLITLGIIGIIAALTIPTLMNKTQDLEFKSALKKTYSSLSQAYLSILSDNNGSFAGVYTSSDSLRDVFKEKMKSLKTCNYNDSSTLGACFPLDSQIRYLDGSATTTAYTNNNSGSYLVLSDGTAFAFFGDTPGCTRTDTMGRKDRCAWIIADVNGLKKPNTWGKDIYLFMIFSNAILPASAPLDIQAQDDCNVGYNMGLTCASKYLLNN